MNKFIQFFNVLTIFALLSIASKIIIKIFCNFIFQILNCSLSRSVDLHYALSLNDSLFSNGEWMNIMLWFQELIRLQQIKIINHIIPMEIGCSTNSSTTLDNKIFCYRLFLCFPFCFNFKDHSNNSFPFKLWVVCFISFPDWYILFLLRN